MAALHNLSQSPSVRKSGVLVLSGFGIRVKMECGHLSIEDGVGAERRKLRLPRVGHGLKRIIVIGSDGFATFDAIRWISDVGAALTFLDRRGKVIFVSGPTAPSDARLRRAQSTALGNGVALSISKELIEAKLRAQENFVRHKFNDPANVIAGFRAGLADANNLDKVRMFEGHAAVQYWNVLSSVPVMWSKADRRKTPAHWLEVGPRHSFLTASPRCAVTPFHAILNYIMALCESEARIALVAVGLDPSIGFLHLDRANRDSLALDILEPIRVDCERWLYQWVTSEPLSRRDFLETSSGQVHLMSNLCRKLSETAPVWGKLLAPWTERIAARLWEQVSSRLGRRLLATPLTQANRRAIKGVPLPSVALPKPTHVCRGCGKKIPSGENRCLKCSAPVTRVNFRAGRRLAQSPASLARRSVTQTKHRRAIQDWNPSDLPGWLTRDVFVKQVQPALASVAKSRIRSALGVSEPYSSDIRAGKRIPHPRHWETLAGLVGVSPEL